MAVVRLRFANYDVAVGAVDDCLQLRLLRGRYAELVECLLQIVHERVPFLRRNVHVTMRVGHGASGVFLGAATGPANHLGNEILEASRRNLVMRFVHGWVGVQAGITHDAIDKVIDHGRDAINSAETFVEGRLDLLVMAWVNALACGLLFWEPGVGPLGLSHSFRLQTNSVNLVALGCHNQRSISNVQRLNKNPLNVLLDR